jgi:hypothetical protein
MTAPLRAGKQSVNLGSSEVRVSRIRRDPPPVVKQLEVRDPKELERRDVIIGVIVFALAIFVILMAFGAFSGWSPREYTVEV